MKMYRTAAGLFARTKDEAGKGHTAVEVPTDARGLVAYLNSLAAPPESLAQTIQSAQALVAEVQDAPAPSEPQRAYSPPGDDHDNYASPISARTCIAGIDAGMVSAAVRQFNGTNLAKVMTAGIERMAELARGVA